MPAAIANSAKQTFRGSFPGVYRVLFRMKWAATTWWTTRIRSPRRTYWSHYRFRRIIRHLLASHGLAVQGGPFAGMVYVPNAVNAQTYGWFCSGALVPKLLGCYEAELHDIFARILEKGYERVVNIGCGEGYYAIGLALRLPGAIVHAFDLDPMARQNCLDMAYANGVAQRVIVGERCDHEQLRILTLNPAVIICDCEGCELDLLRPDLVPGLRACDILVELHDSLDASISGTIVARFSGTHDISLVTSAERDPGAYSVLDNLGGNDRQRAVSEFRPAGMRWAFMQVNSAPPLPAG